MQFSLSLINKKVVKFLKFTASTVRCSAPTTVDTIRVTYRTGIALDANPDGQGLFVTWVSIFSVYSMFENE